MVVALDDVGRELGKECFPAIVAGHGDIVDWLGGWGNVVTVGVEETGNWSGTLAAELEAAHMRVLVVNRPHREHDHHGGKSDFAEALAVARAALGSPASRHSPADDKITLPGVPAVPVVPEGAQMRSTKRSAAGRVRQKESVLTERRIRTRLLHEADDVLPGGVIRAHPITLAWDVVLLVAGTVLVLTPRGAVDTLWVTGISVAILRVLRQIRAGLYVPRYWKDYAGTVAYLAATPALWWLTSGWNPVAIRAITWLYLLAYLLWRCVLWWANLTVITSSTLTRIISVISDETPSIEKRHYGPKTVRRSILGRIVGYGTLHMDTPSAKDAVLGYIPNIPRPYEVKEMLIVKQEPVDTDVRWNR